MSQFLKTRRLTAWAVVVSAALLSAGCGGGNSAPKNEKGSSGFAVDGYLKDSTVLCDSNSNGSADTGETNVITNSGGGFVFPTVCTAPLVLIGGVSTDTNLPFIGKLKAPAGSKLITPLTTLMAEGMTQAQIISALGLLANTDVLNTDPAYAPSGVYVNDRLMKVTAATQLSVQKSTEIIAALAGGASAADKQAIYNEVMAAVVAQLKASNTSLIAANVVDQTVVAKLVEAATARIAQSSNVSAAVKAAASSINPASLGEVVAGGMKFQMEALLGAGQGLATATIVQSNDAKITAFVTANKPALAGAPSAAITTLGTTLTSQFSSTVTPPPVVTNGLPITFDNAAVTYTLTDFGGNIGSVVTDPAGGTNKVAKLIKGAAGIPSEVWAGTTISTGANNSIATIPLAVGATSMTMRVWSPAAGLPIRLKLEDAAVVTHTVETEAITTVANTWETLTFNFANPATNGGNPTAAFNATFTYNKASVFANFNTGESGVTYYFDDLTFGGAVSPPVTATAPTTAAPTPTELAANVKSIYSDAYTQIAGVNLNPNWSQTTVVTEVPIAGNNAQKYATLNYQGIDFVANPIDVSAMSNLHIDVWTANVDTVKVSIISTTPTAAETAYILTPTKSGWNSFDIPMASYTAPDKTKIDQVKIEGLPAAGTLYFDNLYFWKAPAVVVATAPTTAAPTPTVAAAGVLSIYSDAYPQIAGVNLNPNWGQTTAVTEVLVAGNNTQKYATLNYQGIDFVNNAIDVSAMSSLHIDVWTANVTTLKVSIISTATAAETAVTLTPTQAGWNSFDIPLASYTAPDKTKIDQVKIEGLPAAGTLYFDNLYFWKAPAVVVATAPTTAAPTPTVAAAGVLSIYSDAYPQIAGVNLNPNWGQTTAVTEVLVAGNNAQKYATLNYQGIDFAANTIDVSTKSKLHIDVWSQDITTVNLFIISAGAENPVPLTLTPGQWNSFDIDLGLYTAPNKTAIMQVKFDTQSAGGTLFFDNLYFWGTAAVTPPTVGTFTGGIFADDYTGSLAVAQGQVGAAKSTLGGDVGFFYDGRLAATKLYDFGGMFNSASAGGAAPGAVHNFYYGLGLNSPAITDAYFGAFVNAPNNATADASAFTKVNVNFWGPAELFEKSFTPQVQVVLAGPPIAGCTSGSGRAEMQAIVSGLKIGAASTYIIPLTAFTMKAACGADTTTAAVWAHVGQVSVTLANTNVQYVVVDPNNANVYPNGLNIGSIKFN